MIGIDTNVVLRWLLDDSIAHPDEQDAMQASKVADLVLDSNKTFLVNHVVIAEAIWIAVQKVDRRKDKVVEVMNRLVNAGNVVVDNPKVVNAALLSFEKSPGDFADHLIGEINHSLGCTTTLTFDKAASKSPRFTQFA